MAQLVIATQCCMFVSKTGSMAGMILSVSNFGCKTNCRQAPRPLSHDRVLLEAIRSIGIIKFSCQTCRVAKCIIIGKDGLKSEVGKVSETCIYKQWEDYRAVCSQSSGQQLIVLSKKQAHIVH